MALGKKNVHPVDPLLTQFVIQYSQETDGFIADKLFPSIAAPSGESGTFYTFKDSKGFFTLPNKTERAPGTKYGRGQLFIGTDTYQTIQDGWEIAVDDRVQANALKPYNPRRTAAESAAQVILLRRENRVISAITDSTVWSSQTAALAVGDRWDNNNSDPVGIVDQYKEVIRKACGRIPNKMVLPYDVWLKIKEHSDIKARIKTTTDTIVTIDLLKRLFEMEELLISQSLYNTAEEGQDVTLADMMSKKVFMGYINKTPGIMRPSVGYNIQVNGLQAKTYREDQTDSEIARTTVNEVQKVCAVDCGYLLTTVIS
jgi:hypothetical protein